MRGQACENKYLQQQKRKRKKKKKAYNYVVNLRIKISPCKHSCI